jgi:hypothetical protein
VDTQKGGITMESKWLAKEIADNYAWRYSIGNRYHIENGFGYVWEYDTA